jgi:hypothetical protein
VYHWCQGWSSQNGEQVVIHLYSTQRFSGILFLREEQNKLHPQGNLFSSVFGKYSFMCGLQLTGRDLRTITVYGSPTSESGTAGATLGTRVTA